MSVEEYGQCGTLDWTVKKWGRVTHKHACPNRTDPWCQTHPKEHCPPLTSIDDRLGDVYDAAGAYLTACDQIDNADAAGMLEAIVRRDAAFAELRAARYPEQHA